MVIIFCRDLPLGIWRLLNPRRVYSDTFCALWGAKKAKNFHFFMVCAISHSQLGYAQWPWFLKNDHLLTFAPIESDLSVVRPPRLLWEIDMIMRKLANTNFMSWEATENFLEGFEVAVATLWNSPFEVTGRGRKRCLSMIFEKWPFAYLCAHRIWSKRRTTTPFALGDRYDHEEACKHKFHVMGSYRKFFGGLWSRRRHFVKLSFWSHREG